MGGRQSPAPEKSGRLPARSSRHFHLFTFTRERPTSGRGAGPRSPAAGGGGGAAAGSRGEAPGGGTMVCGGFACSKNCLCALNLLYTVRGSG